MKNFQENYENNLMRIDSSIKELQYKISVEEAKRNRINVLMGLFGIEDIEAKMNAMKLDVSCRNIRLQVSAEVYEKPTIEEINNGKLYVELDIKPNPTSQWKRLSWKGYTPGGSSKNDKARTATCKRFDDKLQSAFGFRFSSNDRCFEEDSRDREFVIYTNMMIIESK